MSTAGRKTFSVEQRSVEFIPLNERNGKAGDLFGIWFGFNMIPLALITGAIGVSAGLTFTWSVIAILIGALLGGLTMGLHASQGPTLGVPQMLQARGQFGSQGAGLLIIMVLLIMIGFFVSNLVVASQALVLAVPHVPLNLAIFVATLASFIITTVGYGLVRGLSSITAWVIGTVLVLLLAEGVFQFSDYKVALSQGGFTIAAFFMTMMVAASWLIGFAPYVSDYSRYMAPDSDEKKAFWGTYLGCTLGAVMAMIVGAFLATQLDSSDPLLALKENYGTTGYVILIMFFVATALVNCINSYTAMLSLLTLVKSALPEAPITQRVRLCAVIFIHVLAYYLATAASSDFLNHFINFISFLIYFLVPWSAINLVDFFLIKKGHYDIDSFFKAGGGVYGRWNKNAMFIYGITMLVEFPFMKTTLYTGPMVAVLQGVDIAWVVGFIFSGYVYYLTNKAKEQ